MGASDAGEQGRLSGHARQGVLHGAGNCGHQGKWRILQTRSRAVLVLKTRVISTGLNNFGYIALRWSYELGSLDKEDGGG